MSDRLSDKITLVIDGTDAVGSGIVRAFLKEDATVIVPAASVNHLNQLKKCLGETKQDKLVTFLTDLSDFSKVADCAELLCQQFGRIDLAATYVNTNCSSGLFTKADLNEWHQLNNNLTTYFTAGRAMLMLMNDPESMYVTISNAEYLKQKAHNSLHHLESLLQMEMAGLYAEEKKHIKSRYHHIYIGHESTLVGKQIIDLYHKKVKDPDKIFQSFMNVTVYDELTPIMLKD